jgi:hypothetical protein
LITDFEKGLDAETEVFILLLPLNPTVDFCFLGENCSVAAFFGNKLLAVAGFI